MGIRDPNRTSIQEMVGEGMLLKILKIRMSQRLEVVLLLANLMPLEGTFRVINRAQSILPIKKSHIK
jgi:hypothetical protein